MRETMYRQPSTFTFLSYNGYNIGRFELGSTSS